MRRHYGEKCLRCGATDRTLTRDHVVPLALGGADTIDNIQPLCGPCNRWKDARVIDFRDGWEEGKPVPKDFREAVGEGRWLPVNAASDALISEMRDRIESLERQLEQERQANSEHRRLLAAALESGSLRS